MSTRSSRAPLLFFLQTVVCQAIAVSVLFVVWQLVQSLPLALSSSALAGFATAHLLGLSAPWCVLNLVLPPALAAALAVQVPAWVFLVLFLGSLLTYAPAFWTRVPYYPTHRAAYALILAELPHDRPFTFIDIGCGTGDLLLFLSVRRPTGRFIGVEIGLVPWFIAKLRSLLARPSSVTVHFQTMWGLDLGRYDFVYTFLSPAPMERLWAKAKEEMKTGSTFITNTFETPEQASYTIAIKNERQTALYVHRIVQEDTQNPTAS